MASSMATVDVVSRMNFAELDNAINNMKKMMSQRFDFRGAVWTIDVDQKEKSIKITCEDGTKHRALQEAFLQNAMRRGLDPRAFKFEEPESGAAGALKRTVKIINGLDQDTAKTIVRLVKATGLKVQASIQGEEVRLSGKQIDDLQACMKLLTDNDEVGAPVQFVNMKR